MTTFPIIIDSKPGYLRDGDGPVSIALLPYGRTTILAHVAARLVEITRRKPSVVRTFEADGRYDDAIATAGDIVGVSACADKFAARMASFEPSDWLLFVDLRCFASSGFDPQPLFEDVSATPRIARHLVALDWNNGGTNERVEFDAAGLVRRVQRYYDAVTWTVSSGVACSLIPVSALSMSQGWPFGSLTAVRSELASRAVPSRDVPISGAVVDLTTERGVLRLNERALHHLAKTVDPARRGAQPRPIVSDRASVHPSARLAGLVSVHDDVTIEEHVSIIGPAVIGAGARIQRGAAIVQSVVAPGAVVPQGMIVRHRVVSGALEHDLAQAAASILADDTAAGDAMPLQEEDRPQRVYPRIKRMAEGALAAAALIILSPVLALIAALVKLESRGPVLYGDPREAKNGRLFRCYKFRTMSVGAAAAQRDLMDANQLDGPQFKLERDPRVTRLGRWLRALSLDELPQLINVALGQMSLVGPRPSPFRENQLCVPWREARLSVRPGITGLWQVCRHDRANGDFHQWIYYDIKYVRNMSFLVDLKILIATILTLGGKGHVPLSWIISSHHSREGA